MVLAATVAAVILLAAAGAKAQLAIADRVDCHPDPGASEAGCVARGCIFEAIDEQGPPSCYYPEDYGYTMYGEVRETDIGFIAELVKSGPPAFVPDEFSLLVVEVEFQSEERLRVKIHPNVPRYEVPICFTRPSSKPTMTLYDIEFVSDPVFSFRVLRKATGTVIFDSSLGGLTFAHQFVQIAAKLPSENVYGFGEHELTSFRHNMSAWKTLGMFATDRWPEPEIALYGVQPHYTVVEDSDGNTHSALFLNSNAQEVVLTPAPGIIYRTIGGVLDLYFFLGPTPEEAVQQFTSAVGRQHLPAYWSLGFHLCRWGYNSTDNMRAAFNRTAAAGIPQDAQWGDIDVMDRKIDFTLDIVNYADLPDFIQELHDNGQRFVVILDPAIPEGEPPGTYPAYEEGMEKGVWILNATGQPLKGYVWPMSATHFPDFTNPVTEEWWNDQIVAWRDLIAFDGLWIDMNEVSNFVNGSTEGCRVNNLNNPPYLPRISTDNINAKTICMDSQGLGGLQYDTHSMYGWWEAKATRAAVHAATAERGIVLSRSTFVGSGHFAAHWLGDNWSQWDNLKASIIGIMQFNQFGIPLVGADICGFLGDTTEEMCLRWHQLGAFYPFSRNHNLLESRDQDPGQWPSVAKAAKKTLEIRYSLLPYLYSLFFSHSLRGGTVVRPLWHEFPSDATALGVDEQFLWGHGFLVSPALNEGQVEVRAYFPDARWFDFFSHQEVAARGDFVILDCPLEVIPIHVRGGTILIRQNAARTTAATRKNNFELIVAMDDSSSASGELFWDDGVSIDDDLQNYSHLNFTATTNSLSVAVLKSDFSGLGELAFEKINVWGLMQTVADVGVVVGDDDVRQCEWTQTGHELVVTCAGENRINALSSWSLMWTAAKVKDTLPKVIVVS